MIKISYKGILFFIITGILESLAIYHDMVRYGRQIQLTLILIFAGAFFLWFGMKAFEDKNKSKPIE